MIFSFQDVHCTFKMYVDEEVYTTDKISLTANPDFNYSKLFRFNPATAQFVKWLSNEFLMVEIMGKQYIRKSAVAKNKHLTTRDMLRQDRGVFSK